MTELQLARGATKWLRSLGLAVIGLLVAAVVSVTSFLSAQSSADGSASEIDYALSVNQTNYASGGNTVALGANVSWEAWINPTSGGSGQHWTFLSKEGSFAFSILNGVLHWHAGTGSAWAGSWTSTGVPVQTGRWSHFGASISGNLLSIYLDGHWQTNLTAASSNMAPNSTYAINVGSRAAGEHMVGQIDEVKIWTTSRGSWQMAESMHSKVSGATSGLSAYWDFNEPSGSTVFNRTGAGNNLTLQGSPARVDVKRITPLSSGETLVTFPRTYLPGIGAWKVPTNVSSFRALVVAGGGGGGGWIDGGGGGAGGVVQFQSVSLSSNVTIKVGQGGRGGKSVENTDNHGLSGQASVLGSVVAIGGGGGGGYGYPDFTDRGVGYSGGSGGGHGELNSSPAGSAGTQATDATTYAGGVEYGNASGGIYPGSQAGSGGGGAGGAGGTVSQFRVGGAGGAGMSSNITGTDVFYAAGGGGADRDGTGASGGSGIGGNGGGPNNSSTAGAVGTGSGGGGTYSGIGSNGGSGVVIVRYATNKDLVWDKNNAAESFAYTDSQVVPATGNFTYEAWYYLDANDVSGGYRGIFSQMDTGQSYAQRASLWLNNGYLHYTYGGGLNNTLSTFQFRQDRWYHIALVRNGGDVEVFIDGIKLVDEAVTWGAIGPRFTIGGAQQWDLAYPEISGAIDQVKVWTTALDATGVQASMHTYSSSGVTGTLKAHYDFNEFEDGIVRDRTGNNNNLVFNTAVAGGYAEANFNDTFLVDTGTAHSQQSYVRFKRSYLTATGGYTLPSGITKYKAAIIGGGGGGGSMVGGGGGAGGFTESQSLTLTPQAISVVVGQGGFGATMFGSTTDNYLSNGVHRTANSGQASKLGSITMNGGGRGATLTRPNVGYADVNALSGGSGGGGGGISRRRN